MGQKFVFGNIYIVFSLWSMVILLVKNEKNEKIGEKMNERKMMKKKKGQTLN